MLKNARPFPGGRLVHVLFYASMITHDERRLPRRGWRSPQGSQRPFSSPSMRPVAQAHAHGLLRPGADARPRPAHG